MYGFLFLEIKFGVTNDAVITIPRRQKKNLKFDYIIDQKLTAPIQQNETIGYLNVKLKDQVIQTYKLTALENINQGSLYRRTLDSLLMDL